MKIALSMRTSHLSDEDLSCSVIMELEAALDKAFEAVGDSGY